MCTYRAKASYEQKKTCHNCNSNSQSTLCTTMPESVEFISGIFHILFAKDFIPFIIVLICRNHSHNNKKTPISHIPRYYLLISMNSSTSTRLSTTSSMESLRKSNKSKPVTSSTELTEHITSSIVVTDALFGHRNAIE